MNVEPREVWHLPTRHLGRRVLVFDRVESTNTLALAHEDPHEGLAFLADEQTAGRGQHGRRWLARPRSSVLLTVLMHPPAEVAHPAVLTALAAVSVCKLVESLTPCRPRIKWPNDVLLDGRKVCGILIEQRHGRRPATAAGIGLNATQTDQDFAEAGLPVATSLQARGAAPDTTHRVAARLLTHIDEEYHRLLTGQVDDLERDWQEYFDLAGQNVEAECRDGWVTGRLLSLTFSGVRVELPGGKVRTIPPETILHLRAL